MQLASKIVTAGGEVVSAASNYGDLDVYAVKEANGHLDLLVINTNPAASLTDQFNVTGFQPGGSAQVWQYGESQDTAQSQTANGASALANFDATLNLSGGQFQLRVSGLFDDGSRLGAGAARRRHLERRHACDGRLCNGHRLGTHAHRWQF